MRCSPAILIVAAGLAGCGGPVVTMSYTFSPDLPVPATGLVRVGPFTVAEGTDARYGAVAAEALARRLRDSFWFAPADASGAAQMAIAATVRLTACDTGGARTVRKFNPQRNTTESVRVATLIRTASARMVFTVTDPAGGGQFASAETRRNYTSADDPRTRGDLGLLRPDDPANVPPIDTIHRELIDHCVQTFWDMLQPRTIVVTVQLRPTVNPDGVQGLAAAGNGEFTHAAGHFAAAVAAEPSNPDLLFNHAVTAEKAGQFPTALAAYNRLLLLPRGHQLLAYQGAQRIKRVMRQQKKKQ